MSASPEAEKVTVWIEYIVTRGDTLYCIAVRNNMPLSKLLALNPQIKNPNRIYPEQKISLGQTAVAVTDPAATAKNAVYYTIVRGDGLFKIARKTGLKLNQLIAMNMDIARQKYIYAGQRVRVSKLSDSKKIHFLLKKIHFISERLIVYYIWF